MLDTPERILRIKSVLERTGLTRSTLYRKMQAGSFPRQVRISTRCAGWHESAVKAWLKNPVYYSAADETEVIPQRSRRPRRTQPLEPSTCSDEPMLPLERGAS